MFTKYLGVIKTIGLIAAGIFIIWLVFYIQGLRNDSKIAELNEQWQRAEERAKFTQQVKDLDGIRYYLDTENKSLLNRLKTAGIKDNRIESIISQLLTYRDTLTRSTDISALLEAIKDKRPTSEAFIDSTKCLTVKGLVSYKNDSLKVSILSRDFNNKSDVVGYWQRRKWKFLFWETTFLGEKEVTAQSFSDCGEVRTVRIERKP